MDIKILSFSGGNSGTEALGGSDIVADRVLSICSRKSAFSFSLAFFSPWNWIVPVDSYRLMTALLRVLI
ncbi:hypothetical protein [Bartonella sp. CB60]|uniref:hypothetical protein n=1 Tax=Bartonella sp. CB60 TaxID=3113619 RepID=UPI00300E52E2